MIFSLIFLSSLFAQDFFCPMLEKAGFSLDSCVPTTGAICHSGQPGNCEIRGTKKECEYIRGPGAFKVKVELDPGFNCVHYADDICVTDPLTDTTICQPGPCDKYVPPNCHVECTQCYQEKIQREFPIKGCNKHCGERYCADEPSCADPPPGCPGQPGCPISNEVCEVKRIADPDGGADYIYPANPRQKCAQDVLCPDTANPIGAGQGGANITPENCPTCVFDSNGQVVLSNNNDMNCEPEPIEINTTPVRNESCPWIREDERHISGNGPMVCEPISVGNRYPQDCKECDPSQPDSNICNIPAELIAVKCGGQ